MGAGRPTKPLNPGGYSAMGYSGTGIEAGAGSWRGGGTSMGAGSTSTTAAITTATGTSDAPLTPRYTSVDYGPLVAQAIKKRFGRSQTILGGTQTALELISTGQKLPFTRSIKPDIFAGFTSFAKNFIQSPMGTLLTRLTKGKTLLGG